jgi:predicted nucleic acid-binding protein
VLAIDANLWVAAFDPADRFHEDSVALFRAAAQRGLRLAGPAFVLLESVCALRRRLGDPETARAVGVKIAEYPALHLEPLTGDLLAEAQRLGIDRGLRGADALYAATAARLRCPLLSWDGELIARAGAISPSDWLVATPAP